MPGLSGVPSFKVINKRRCAVFPDAGSSFNSAPPASDTNVFRHNRRLGDGENVLTYGEIGSTVLASENIIVLRQVHDRWLPCPSLSGPAVQGFISRATIALIK